MESSDVDATDVATTIPIASNDVADDASPTFTGPLQQFVLSAVDRLRHVETKDELTSSLSRDLVTSYSQLDKVARPGVDEQLVDILHVLTTRGLDVNAVCDDDRQTPLHVIASVPDADRQENRFPLLLRCYVWTQVSPRCSSRIHESNPFTCPQLPINIIVIESHRIIADFPNGKKLTW